MEISSIVQAKNNLPRLIHAAEAGEDVCISRHGKLVAVLVSAARYQQHFGTGGVFAAIQQWCTSEVAPELADAEVADWRDRGAGRDFAWD